MTLVGAPPRFVGWSVRWTLGLVFIALAMTTLIAETTPAALAPSATSAVWAAYDYDSPIAATTIAPNTRTATRFARDGPARNPRTASLALVLRCAAKEADEGIVYLRSDAAGGKPCVGQSKSPGRFEARQGEHARENPFGDFSYRELGRAAPGRDLDRLEEYYIRQFGGPTNKSNPFGELANRRHQMSDPRYQAAGGDF